MDKRSGLGNVSDPICCSLNALSTQISSSCRSLSLGEFGYSDPCKREALKPQSPQSSALGAFEAPKPQNLQAATGQGFGVPKPRACAA